MLILSRRVGQKISIGGVILEVTEIRHGSVRLGIDAPKDIRIDRLGSDGNPEAAHKGAPPAPSA